MYKEADVRKRSLSRFVNGIVSAIIVCFFAAHGLIGSFASVFSFTSALRWVVWVGVALVALHVLLSALTSYLQMTDAEFPPSARKKRHLVLKWATGILLALMVVAHITCMRVSGALVPVLSAVVTALVAVALAVHVWVGAKSLLKDIGAGTALMTPLRVVMCALAAVFAVTALSMLAG